MAPGADWWLGRAAALGTRLCTNDAMRLAAKTIFCIPSIVTLKVTMVIVKEASVRVTAFLHSRDKGVYLPA